MERLQKCEGTTKALKIAGLSTIGLTAVGVVGNVVEAQKLQTYQGQSNALDTQITQTKKEIEDKKAAAAAASGPSATPPAATTFTETPTTPTAANPENTIGDTVCGIKCDESYKDKTIVCKTDNKYALYKCSDNKWTKDNVQTCNDRMIADSTYTKIEQYDGTANTYLFSLPGKSKISNKEAYLGTDVCYACERWNEGTWVYKDGKCAKVGYAKTCDSGKKTGDDCKADKPHATAAQCKSIGAKSNGKAIFTCVATACDSGYKVDNGNCVKQQATNATTTTPTTTTPTTTGLAAVDINVNGKSAKSYNKDGSCDRYENGEWKKDLAKPAQTCSELGKGQWKVGFSYGLVSGNSRCSSTNGTYAVAGNPASSDWQYCWCKVKYYTPSGSNDRQKVEPLSSWVFYDSISGNCAYTCAYSCAVQMRAYPGFRKTAFAGTGN